MEFEHMDILQEYDFMNPEVRFIRHGENKVFQLIDNNVKYTIRIHKSVEGFSLDLHQRQYSIKEYVTAEMDVLEHVYNKGNVHIQRPIKNKKGNYVTFL
jgi:hypothetical protein